MKSTPQFIFRRGFTLMETVIAIGVVSVLLTGFLIVFVPAADGIKKAISIQEADRLVSALENELVTLRTVDSDITGTTGFDKAFSRIRQSTGLIAANLDKGTANNALLVYQYRGNQKLSPRTDGTLAPVASVKGKAAGEDYTLIPMMRKKDDPLLLEDLPAIEGPVYIAKCIQMVYVPDPTNPGQYALEPLPSTGAKQRGNIYDPSPESDDTAIVDSTTYPDAVIAFAAEFYPSPSKSSGFLTGTGFTEFYERSVKPTFTRNLAIRR